MCPQSIGPVKESEKMLQRCKMKSVRLGLRRGRDSAKGNASEELEGVLGQGLGNHDGEVVLRGNKLEYNETGLDPLPHAIVAEVDEARL